jgi:DNA-binding LytR/AlgR family response regulator
MKLKCLVVDDEPVARRLLREYIDDIPFLEISGEADDPLKAQAFLDQEQVDLMFLDINMPRLSGIEFLKHGASLPMTVMTTAYAEYAVEGFALDVLDYLVKPFSFARFLKACNKAKEYYELRKHPGQTSGAGSNCFFVKSNGRIEKILYDDLLFAEAALNYVNLYTTTGKFMVYLTIKGIAEQLPAASFARVHKSFVVNVDKIRAIEGEIIHIGKSQVPIGQNYQDQVMPLILKDRLLKR